MSEQRIDPGPLPPFASFSSAHRAEKSPRALLPEELALLRPETVERRRESFRLGRQAAHQALGVLGRDKGPILAGENREPIWPDGVVGSIAHAAGRGVALVAPSERSDGVGIDLEARRPAPELADLVPRAEERSWIDDLDEGEQRDALLALFSAKESIYKAFFPRVGTFFGFDAASLVPARDGFTAQLVADLDPDYPPHRTFDVWCGWQGDLVLTRLVLPKT